MNSVPNPDYFIEKIEYLEYYDEEDFDKLISLAKDFHRELGRVVDSTNEYLIWANETIKNNQPNHNAGFKKKGQLFKMIKREMIFLLGKFKGSRQDSHA